MTFKVFISSSVLDSTVANELKNNLERYGIISVLSPNNEAMSLPYEQFVRNQIQTSDCLLAIMGKGGSRLENVNYELGMAVALNKIVLPFVEKGSNIPQFLAQKAFIVFDRDNPRLSYERTAQYLNQLKIEKEKRDSIGGLLLLGLGIILLGALASSE
ncbi:MAG: toll/interleukin-1 receptor domain-containing protein [Candidatus Bathyarchaeia archaeon]|jgi:hypothetical protein